MTDYGYAYDDAAAIDDGGAHGARAQTLVNLTGGLVSLALVVGMGVWGYKLLVRDVSGVPVIEAIEGAFRVEPEEPGGMTTPHQGLQVNEIAADSEPSAPVEEVRLAPEDGALAEEDWPWGDLMEQSVQTEAALARDAEDGDAAATPLVDGEEGGLMAMDAPDEDLSPAVMVEDDLEGEALGTDLAVAEALAGVELDPAVADEGDVEVPVSIASASNALRPAPRPAVLRRTATPARAVPPGAGPGGVGTGEVSIDTLEKGTRLVQLGAYASPEIAREQWSSIGGKFAEFFADKRLVVQKAVSGGKTFYRLRAEGFEDLADARRFCSTLTARQADCIPVEVR